MKAAQIVSSHDPDKKNPGAVAAQITDSLEGVARADLRFETEHFNARMTSEPACGCDAILQRCKAARVFERIAWGYEPPDAIEIEPFYCNQARRQMRIVRRVKGAPE